MHTLALARRSAHGGQRRASSLFCRDRHAGPSATEVVIGANGKILVAPVGTTAPTDLATAWVSGWVDLGFADTSGVKLTDSKTMAEVDVWQNFYPVRRFITKREFTAAFNLVQFNKTTIALALGGGTVTTPGAGVYKYTPPDPSLIDERALGVEWTDGSKIYRLILPKGLVTDNVQTDVARTKESVLPITFGITTTGAGDPYTLLTSDASFS